MLVLPAWCGRYEWHSRGWFDQVVKGVVHVFCMSFKLAERCTHPVRPLQIDFKYLYFRLKQFYFWSTHFLLKTPSVRVFCRLMLPPGRCLLPLCMHFVQKCGKRRVQNAKPTASILLLLVVDYLSFFLFLEEKECEEIDVHRLYRLRSLHVHSLQLHESDFHSTTIIRLHLLHICSFR